MRVEQIRVDPDPYSPSASRRAFAVGELLFISGQAAIDEHGEIVGAGGLRCPGSSRRSATWRRVLEAGGSSLERVVKVTIFLTDMGKFPKVGWT